MMSRLSSLKHANLPEDSVLAELFEVHPRDLFGENGWDRTSQVLCVPCNIGWRKNLTNVMGRGIAKEVAAIFPDLSRWYGEFCYLNTREGYSTAGTVAYPGELIWMFPTKPLDLLHPELSWKQPSSLDLILQSMNQLLQMAALDQTRFILLPLPGCGNGGLSWEGLVKPALIDLCNQTYGLYYHISVGYEPWDHIQFVTKPE